MNYKPIVNERRTPCFDMDQDGKDYSRREVASEVARHPEELR